MLGRLLAGVSGTSTYHSSCYCLGKAAASTSQVIWGVRNPLLTISCTDAIKHHTLHHPDADKGP